MYWKKSAVPMCSRVLSRGIFNKRSAPSYGQSTKAGTKKGSLQIISGHLRRNAGLNGRVLQHLFFALYSIMKNKVGVRTPRPNVSDKRNWDHQRAIARSGFNFNRHGRLNSLPVPTYGCGFAANALSWILQFGRTRQSSVLNSDLVSANSIG